MKAKYVALGDLVVDCYYRKTKQNGRESIQPMKVDGGSSRFNVIANLAARENNTAVISGYGNNELGFIAFDSLKRLNVDVTKTKKAGDETRAYHLIVEGDKHISTKICPICGKRTWYEPQIADTDYCLSRLNPNDIIILDGLKPENIPILKEAKNEKVLDIGRVKRLQKLTNVEILTAVRKNNIQILQLNESVEKYIEEHFHLKNILEVFYLLGPEFLIVTRGKNGADFVDRNGVIYHKELSHPTYEKDDTGAGDAFFSMFIQKYYDNSKKVDKYFIDSTFDMASKLTANVVSHIGARGHLYDGYYLDVDMDSNCIC